MKSNKNFVGRGSNNRQSGRFERLEIVNLESDKFDGKSKVQTDFFEDDSETIVSRNTSPDIHFNYSLNPYRGCAHGCSYCYARPSHEYLGWGPGLDFETKIVIKRRAGFLFRKWLKQRKPGEIEPVMMSGITDCYQPCERKFELTRDCLRAALEFRHPIQVITKNSLICRDIDLLSELASMRLVDVTISITSLVQSVTRTMEPRTSSPRSRLNTISKLSEAGIPVVASISPIIPGINDEEIPQLLKAVGEHGACSAFYVMLRLPITVKDVFVAWLQENYPDRKSKIISRIMALRDGKLNSSKFGDRMHGTGVWADQISKLFTLFSRQYNLNEKPKPLATDLFRVVNEQGNFQTELF